MRYVNQTVQSSVEVKVKCPEGHETLIDPDEITAHEEDCSLCGYHGDIEFSWKCEECKKGYIYTLKSW